MEEKENFCIETFEPPLTTELKERGDETADNLDGIGSGAERGPNLGAPEKEVLAGIFQACEVEVEITDDKPTEAERKAVEDFFDWLLAEALRLAGEFGKAA